MCSDPSRPRYTTGSSWAGISGQQGVGSTEESDRHPSPQMPDVLAEKLLQVENFTFWNLRGNDSADALRRTGDLTHKIKYSCFSLILFVLSNLTFLFFLSTVRTPNREMKALLYSRWSLRSFEIDRVGTTRDTAKVILIPAPFFRPLLRFAPSYSSWLQSTRTTDTPPLPAPWPIANYNSNLKAPDGISM